MKTKIYSLQDENSIKYIGKTIKGLNERLHLHLIESRRGKKNHRCNWIRSVLARGKWPSIFLIGEIEGDGCAEEIAWIKYFRDEGIELVNGTNGGEGCLGYKHTKESLQKMSVAAIRRSSSKEGRQKLRFARSKSSGHTGYKHSLESRQKISQHLIGKPSPNKGKRLSCEWRKKISESRKGQMIPVETRIKMSEAHKKRWDKRRLS